MINFFYQIISAVIHYLSADWYILLMGILLAVSINVYLDSDKLKKFLERKAGISIPGSVVLGALTPLCACGTMAVLISMFVSAMPWGPVMAFLISSPLSSPSEYIYQTAFLGSEFANAMFVSSIMLGLSAGFAAYLLEKKTNFFKGQFRFDKSGKKSCCTETRPDGNPCCNTEIAATKSCCNKEDKHINSIIEKYKLHEFGKQFIEIGIKKVLFYFVIFIAIGKVVEIAIPKDWIISLFGNSKAYSVPLASTIGLPLYLNDSSSLPLLKAFINSGAGKGSVLAFLIAGKATGVPVIAGMSTFLKKRAMAFYVGYIYIGSMAAGFIYQFIIK